jgi:iron(III) transport system substrate-binding protein
MVLAVAALLGLATGCGGDDDPAADTGADEKLVVYSGREEELVEPLFDRFEAETGIDVEVRYGDSAELAATIAEEGDNSPADVFFAQDPGSLGAVEREGLLAALPQDALDRVPARFRDPDGHWVGTSGRSRVIAYNTDSLSEDDVPDSVFALTDPKWKGKIGIAPTNASFQAFVGAMLLELGEERTREWLEGLKANEPKLYEKNTPVVEAVGSGEIELGLVNHYYLYLVKEENPDAAVANHFLTGDDPGALVSVAGVSILETADHADAAQQFVEFLLSEQSQRFYVDEAEEAEYPVVPGIDAKAGLPPLDTLGGPQIQLDQLGPELEQTLELLNAVGFTT